MHAPTCVSCGHTPPIKSPPPLAISPPGRGEDRHFTVMLGNIYAVVCVPHLSHTRSCIALLSDYFESVTCVYSVIFSLQRWCTGCTRANPVPKQAGPPITSVSHESRWQSINAKVASLVFCLLASVEGTAVCLEIPLQSPPPQGGDHHLATVTPPPLRGRPSRAMGGDFKGEGNISAIAL